MNIEGKQVVVTGAAGFIGSHLIEELVARKAHPTAFVHYNSEGRLGNLAHIPSHVLEQVRIVFGDLNSYESIRHVTKGADIVLHLGALISVPYSYADPRGLFQTNVMGTLNVLLACMENGVSRVLHMSTSEVYGNPDLLPIIETAPLRAQSPYSASKIAAEKLVESFSLSYGLSAVTVRAFNTYGPRQSVRAIVPHLVRTISEYAEVHVGNTDTSRDFLFVSDTVAGIVAAIECDALVGECVNLGTGDRHTIDQVIVAVGDLCGVSARIVVDPHRFRPEASEVQRLQADWSKMHKLTGWTPEISLTSGLVRTLEWVTSTNDRPVRKEGWV